MSRLYTTKEIAKELNISPRTIDRWRAKGLPWVRVLGKNNKPEYRYDLNKSKEWLVSKERIVGRPILINEKVDRQGADIEKSSTSTGQIIDTLNDVIAMLREEITNKNNLIETQSRTIENLMGFSQNNLKRITEDQTLKPTKKKKKKKK